MENRILFQNVTPFSVVWHFCNFLMDLANLRGMVGREEQLAGGAGWGTG
jgi:hypothetical protein